MNRLCAASALSLFVLTSLIATACTRSRTPTSATGTVAMTPVASGTPTEVPLVGPLSGPPFDLGDARFFVVNVDKRTILEIGTASPNNQVSSVIWADNSSLLVYTQTATYWISLDGQLISTSPPQTPVPMLGPVEGPCASTGCASISPDGAWSANGTDDQATGYNTTLVDVTSGLAGFRITNSYRAAWSSSGMLAVDGDVCIGTSARQNVFLFDPTTESLTNLTKGLQGQAVDFLWRPGGASLAVDVLLSGDARGLALYGIGGHSQDLAETGGGELQPVQWSPDGKNLIFLHGGGRDLCERTGQPTTLEVLNPYP